MGAIGHEMISIPATDTELGLDERMIDALKAVDIQGIKHNTPAVIEVLDSSAFRDGEVHTGILQQVKSRQKAA